MSATVAAPSSPYRGLAPYGDSDLDALFFFGRERERDVIVANLIAARLTVLYGASGVGKSSVLRAGVVHRLRALARERGEAPEHEVVVVDVWSGDAVDAVLDAVGAARGQSIAAALEAWTREHDAALYVILDQFDEYFLYHGDETGGPLGAELAEVLASPRLPVNVLISLREDALAQLDAFKGLVPNLFANSLRIDRLDRRGARAAIVGPIDRYNELVGEDERMAIEPELVEAVLDEVTAGRVELGSAGRGEVREPPAEEGIEAPFLQLVLERLWQVERGSGSHVLRLETLRRLGGAEAIVSAHLEHALGSLTVTQRDVAANVFKYLVTPSGTKIAHGAADLAQYAEVDPSALEPVLDVLGRERIVRAVNGVPTGAAKYEIFHDVLSDAVLDWRAREQLDRERRTVERRHRRLLFVTAVSLVLLALMAALAVYALVQRSDARTRATEANAHALDARALLAREENPQLGLQLADRAARMVPSAESEETLREALQASRLRDVLRVGGDVVAASFSPDGRRILVASTNGTARLFDARTHRLEHVLRRPGAIRAATFSPDGRFVVTAGENFRAFLWDAGTGAEVRSFRHGTGVRSVSFSHDGTLLATAGGSAVRLWRTSDGSLLHTIPIGRQVGAVALARDGSTAIVTAGDSLVRVVDARTGTLLRTLDEGSRVTSATFSPSGRLIVASGDNKVARIWSTRSGRLLYTLAGHEGIVLRVAVDPRGMLLATASSDGTARIWELGRGRLFSQLSGHLNYVTGAAFDSKGFSVVTWSKDGTARVWDPSGGFARAVLAGHTGAITSASFSPDDRWVVTGGEDGTARIWDPQAEPELALLGTYGGAVNEVVRSRDGRLLLVASDDGARVVDAADGRVVRRLGSRSAVTGVAFTRDGREAVTAAGRSLAVWDLASGRRVVALRQASQIAAVAVGADGTIATAGADGAVRLWRDGRLSLRVPAGDGPLTSVRFDAAGQRFVTASRDRTAKVFTTRGVLVRTFVGHRSVVTSAAFAPGGRRIVTTGGDGDVRIWDVATGRTLHRLLRHFGVVSDAQYSPDGRWIVTAGPVTAGLWSSSGRFSFYLRGHGPVVRTALFEPDSRRIVTAGTDGTVRTWTCDVCGRLPDLLALARTRLAAGR